MNPAILISRMKSLKDTPFSEPRLIIWALGFSVVSTLFFIFVLAYQGKDIPPSLTMASGFVISAFTKRIGEK